MRFCPIDRKKFSDKQPLKIFLNDACDQEENEDMQNFDWPDVHHPIFELYTSTK